MRILILGGTGGANALAARLTGDRVTVSLAGRTARPLLPAAPHRIGGFGGADGLARWLAAEAVEFVVDATHPFAARISANAALACRAAGVPLLALRRPPWRPVAGDRWIEVAAIADAPAALGEAPQRVFLTTGRLDMACFATAPQHRYLLRLIDPPDPPPPLPDCRIVLARGPFAEADEIALIRAEAVTMLVSKNAGGDATYAKIAAARRLGLPVVMVRQPAPPEVPAVDTVDAAARWLDAHRASRGV
jgi:precorrin-6A/cobalt-precorrin-6A reductase